MLARHDGQVVLVWGAIPGERVRARIERSGKGVLFAETVDVLAASPGFEHAAPGGELDLLTGLGESLLPKDMG